MSGCTRAIEAAERYRATRGALADEVMLLRREREQTKDHLRVLLHVIAPQCRPMDTLVGLCIQIDNFIDAKIEELERLRRVERKGNCA